MGVSTKPGAIRIAEAVAADLGCATRSLTTAEATEVWGELGTLIMAASSRISDRKTRDQLNWSPRQGDMLPEIGQARLRKLAEAHN
jgi:hypothetical protein